MFDRTTITPIRTEHVPYEKTVKHVYAPTTEQAEYLEGLQKKAWDSVTDVIVSDIESNFISATEVKINQDLLNRKNIVRAVFTLNGEKFDILIDTHDDYSRDEFLKQVAKKISSEITNDILIKINGIMGK